MEPISAGISAIASLFKGITGFLDAGAQAKAERNAAEQARLEAGVSAQQRLQQGDQAVADAAVQAAANGGGFVGSTQGVLSSLAQQAMFNARAQAYRGVTESQAHLYNAQLAQVQGNNALASSVMEAGSSLLGGFAKQAAARRAASAFTGGSAQKAAPGRAGASDLLTNPLA